MNNCTITSEKIRGLLLKKLEKLDLELEAATAAKRFYKEPALEEALINMHKASIKFEKPAITHINTYYFTDNPVYTPGTNKALVAKEQPDIFASCYGHRNFPLLGKVIKPEIKIDDDRPLDTYISACEAVDKYYELLESLEKLYFALKNVSAVSITTEELLYLSED